MKIRTIIAATGAASAHYGEAQTITKNSVPNIPDKSSIAVEVDNAPGAIHSIATRARPSEQKPLAVFVLDTNDNPLTTPLK